VRSQWRSPSGVRLRAFRRVLPATNSAAPAERVSRFFISIAAQRSRGSNRAPALGTRTPMGSATTCSSASRRPRQHLLTVTRPPSRLLTIRLIQQATSGSVLEVASRRPAPTSGGLLNQPDSQKPARYVHAIASSWMRRANSSSARIYLRNSQAIYKYAAPGARDRITRHVLL